MRDWAFFEFPRPLMTWFLRLSGFFLFPIRAMFRNHLQRLQPRSYFAIAGSPIIAARRKRAARPHLRRIRDAASFELAELKKTLCEDSEIRFDLCDVIRVAFPSGNVGPPAPALVAPCAVRKKGNFR